MDVPARPGDVLSQPTRARVFAMLGELHRAAGTDELAERLQLHPNGVRMHLERLQAAGLVERRQERIARGRPRDTWTISPEAHPGGETPTGYAELSRWLVRVLGAPGGEIDDVEAEGRRIGRELAGVEGSGSAVEHRLFDTLSSLGFAPTREATGDEVTYRLRNCPYRDAVRENQPVVCALHRGMTSGLLDAIDPDASLDGFEPKDPDVAGCLIRVREPRARDVASHPAAATPQPEP